MSGRDVLNSLPIALACVLADDHDDDDDDDHHHHVDANSSQAIQQCALTNASVFSPSPGRMFVI